MMIAALVVLALHAGAWCRSFSTDDAFISYRYAENAARGQGLVWNPGERVEGYTNFLWTVILAVLARLGLSLPRVAPVLGLVCALVAVVVTAGLARRVGAGAWGTAGALALALSGPHALWAGAGLETPLFALLLAAAALLLATEGGLLPAGALLALASLTRPEGLLFGTVALAPALMRRRRGAGRSVLLFLAPVLLHALWRHAFYGDWLPNTFYAKSGGSLVAGGAYLTGHLVRTWPLYALALVGFLRQPRLRPLLAAVPPYLAYVVWTGGDWMPAHRFLVPILPLLAAAAAVGIGELRTRCIRIAAAGLLLGWTLAAALLLLIPELHRPAGPDVLAELGHHLRRTAPPDALVAVVPAGKIPYYSGLRALDMRGLCDRHIARTAPPPGRGVPGHFKRDPDYVLHREPDLVVTTAAVRKTRLDLESGRIPTVLDSYPILSHPLFRQRYVPVRVELERGEKDLLYYRRR